MKKITVALILISISSFSFSQSRRNNHKWGLSFAMNSIQAQVEVPLMTGSGTLMVDADGNIITGGNRIDNSYSFSIIPKYQVNTDILLRFEFGFTKLNLKANSDQKSFMGRAISDIEISTKIYRYAPGFQWTFIRTNYLESYCGISASYTNYKSINHNFYYDHRNITTDTLLNWSSGKEITPGGFAIGVGAFAGFNIFLIKRISFGAELSSSSLYYILGGETIINETDQNLPNPSVSFVSTWTNSYKGFKISKIISSFNITAWF